MTVLLEALLIGVLAAITLLYAFQTRTVYPRWVLKFFRHPWLLLLILIVATFGMQYTPRISSMVILFVVAIWMDYVLFTRKLHGGVKDARVPLPTVEDATRTEVPMALPMLDLTPPIFPTFYGANTMDGKSWSLLQYMDPLAIVSSFVLHAGARNVQFDLTAAQRKLMTLPLTRYVVLFAMFYVSTRNLFWSTILVLAYFLVISVLLNENHPWNVFSRHWLLMEGFTSTDEKEEATPEKVYMDNMKALLR